MVLDRKSSKEYSVNAEVALGLTLGSTLFLLYINDLPDIIYNITTYADILLSTLNVIRHLIHGN